MSEPQSSQTVADQHAAAAAYVRRLHGAAFFDRLPALGSTAETGGHVADGGSYGGGETCG